MSSSNALVSASSGPSWQVDIPSLTQLMINIGVGGLKQLDVAGIGVYTMGALIQLGNVTKTTHEYETALVKCKNKHLASTWIHKTLELAGASNIVVATLLKDRRGINVLALMSTLIPFFDGQTFERLLLGIFEVMEVPDLSRLGLGEVSKVRGVLLPFAQTPDFPSWVTAYHLWFIQTAMTSKSGSIPTSFGVPDPNDILGIIHMIYQMQASDEPYVLHVRGIRGAGWIAAYAVKVCGLRCCSVRSSKESYPINDVLENAQVIFHVDDTDPKVELYCESTVEDFLVPDNSGSSTTDWAVNCDEVNFFRAICPDIHDSRLLSCVSHFVAAKTIQAISHFVHNSRKGPIISWGSESKFPDGFSTYLEDAVPNYQKRAVEILSILGFDPDLDISFYTSKMPPPNDRLPVLTGNKSDINDPFRLKRNVEKYLHPLFWDLEELSAFAETTHAVARAENTPEKDTNISSSSKFFLNPDKLHHSVRTQDFLFTSFRDTLRVICQRRGIKEPWTDDRSVDNLYLVLQTTIQISTVLAFTNWCDDHRRISNAFLEVRPRKRLDTFKDIINMAFNRSSRELAVLLTDALLISTRLNEADLKKKMPWGGQTFSQEWIGQDYEGIVGVDCLACPPLGKVGRGCLLSFFIGHISVHGMKYMSFRQEKETVDRQNLDGLDTMDIFEYKPELLMPTDGFPNIKIRGMNITRDNSVWSSWTFHLNSTMSIPALPRTIADRTFGGMYTLPCPHPPSTPLDKEAAAALFEPQMKFEWMEGLLIWQGVQDCDDFFQTNRIRFFLQQTHGNALGRWITCESDWVWGDYWDTNKTALIFQRRTCLNCVVKAAKTLMDSQGNGTPFTFYGVIIIPDFADLEDED
jgi:hypothetical protein